MPDIILDFQTNHIAWRRLPRLRARVRQAAQTTIDLLPLAHRFPVAATLLFTGNAKIRQLNRDFRGIDKATNVLSFPQYLPAELKQKAKQKARTELGDIALAYQYIAVEAKKENKLLLDHVTHLVVHGLLHLFGYDHEQKKNAEQMEKMEIKILKALGVPDPYALDVAKTKKT